jgi:hypothetical protein
MIAGAGNSDEERLESGMKAVQEQLWRDHRELVEQVTGVAMTSHVLDPVATLDVKANVNLSYTQMRAINKRYLSETGVPLFAPEKQIRDMVKARIVEHVFGSWTQPVAEGKAEKEPVHFFHVSAWTALLRQNVAGFFAGEDAEVMANTIALPLAAGLEELSAMKVVAVNGDDEADCVVVPKTAVVEIVREGNVVRGVRWTENNEQLEQTFDGVVVADDWVPEVVHGRREVG